MVSKGGKIVKVGNNDCINLEIGEDLLRIESVDKSKSTRLGSKAPNAMQIPQHRQPYRPMHASIQVVISYSCFLLVYYIALLAHFKYWLL